MPEKNFRKENLYSAYQCFCCLCYCTLPQTASDFAQLKALTVVLEICVNFFLLSYCSKALQVSCLWFTGKERTIVVLPWKSQSRPP